MSRLHRFYTGPDLKLKKDFWLRNEALLWQWNKVLRFREGEDVVLFDGLQTDRLYKIVKLDKTEAHLQMITELSRLLPKQHVYLFWSLLKKDNDELILQKATELGVSNFVPLITDRTIKKDFNIERARKIVLEASEQCGRSDIPHVREPMHLSKIHDEYKDKVTIYVCEAGEGELEMLDGKIGFLVGPEGGWTQDELDVFHLLGYGRLSLGPFTLRAETAAIVAPSRLL